MRYLPRFFEADCSHIEFVMECLRNTTEIRNMKQYPLGGAVQCADHDQQLLHRTG